MKRIGDHFCDLAERFVTLPLEPKCCSIRTILNAQTSYTAKKDLDQLVRHVHEKTIYYKISHPKLTKDLIKKFIKKAIRNSQLT